VEIREFLRDRLKADEAQALDAASRNAADWTCPSSAILDIGDDDLVLVHDSGVGEHMRRHDPAHVLRAVAAKRFILDRHLPERIGYFDPKTKSGSTFTVCEIDGNGGTTEDAWPCEELKHLAAVWSDHPDYDEAWALTPAS